MDYPSSRPEQNESEIFFDPSILFPVGNEVRMFLRETPDEPRSLCFNLKPGIVNLALPTEDALGDMRFESVLDTLLVYTDAEGNTRIQLAARHPSCRNDECPECDGCSAPSIDFTRKNGLLSSSGQPQQEFQITLTRHQLGMDGWPQLDPFTERQILSFGWPDINKKHAERRAFLTFAEQLKASLSGQRYYTPD